MGRQTTREQDGEEIIRSEDSCNADGNINGYFVPPRDDEAKVENAKRDLEDDHSGCVQRKGDQDVLKKLSATSSRRRFDELVPVSSDRNFQGDNIVCCAHIRWQRPFAAFEMN